MHVRAPRSYSYDVWFDYLRLEENALADEGGTLTKCREVRQRCTELANGRWLGGGWIPVVELRNISCLFML